MAGQKNSIRIDNISNKRPVISDCLVQSERISQLIFVFIEGEEGMLREMKRISKHDSWKIRIGGMVY